MRRLATFKEWQWFNKPDEISAVECALEGWSNVGVDTLECLECQVKLKHPEFAIDDIKRAHKLPKCLNQTKSAYTFPVHTIPELVASVQNRFRLLLEIQDAIPKLQNPLDLTPYKSTIITHPPEKIPNSVYSACANLSLYGWEPLVIKESTKTTPRCYYLKCHLCHRQVNLTKYSRLEQQEAVPVDTASSSTPSTKAATPAPSSATTHAFNAHDEHRWYCPWILHNLSSGDEAGWKQSRDALDSTLSSATNTEQQASPKNSLSSGSPLLLKRRLTASSVASGGSPIRGGSGASGGGERDFSHVQAARASFKHLFSE
ncbi:hypothetical protein BDR26DRAFT_917683 [Obelidium mucronatum]|nr:hypothetical protein BDR26DRAFT_917683 [Obelidium mucronatum]